MARPATLLPPPISALEAIELDDADVESAPDTVPQSYWARGGDTLRCPPPPESVPCPSCGRPLSSRR